MKQTILGFFFLILIVEAAYVNINVASKMERELELSTAVSHCVYETLQSSLLCEGLEPCNLKETFGWMLRQEVSSSGNLDITYVCIDEEKGMLSVKVKQRYQAPDGKSQKVEVSKCGIIDGAEPAIVDIREDEKKAPDESDAEQTDAKQTDTEQTDAEQTDASGPVILVHKKIRMISNQYLDTLAKDSIWRTDPERWKLLTHYSQ